MNLLLLEASEVDDEGVVVIAGARGRHVREVLGAEVGRSVRVGVIDGAIGTAEVIAVDDRAGSVTLRCRLGAVPSRPRVDLVLALPRPKVLARLYAPLASLGVGTLWLTNAERVERFYFDAHAVRPERARPLLLEGLAQARDTRVPIVRVSKSLKRVVEDELDEARSEGGAARRLLADPVYARSPFDVARGTDSTRRVLLALGPEGGWSAYERDLFERHGFVGVGLGPRTLRSDVATIALLALVHAALAD